LAEVAGQVGLTGRLRWAMRRLSWRDHHPGTTMAVMILALADGATAMSDMAMLRGLRTLFGPVASTTTLWRSDDGTVRVWDAGSGVEQQVLTGHNGRVLSVGWSPDGSRIVSASDDGTVRVWDAGSGVEQTAAQATLGFDTIPRHVSWNHNGNSIAVALSNHWHIIHLG
jgi:hypothetical protein